MSKFKLLGVIFDKDFGFDDHFHRILSKAKVRLAILNKVSSCTWGLETGMLRITGKAPVMSLLRYGLVVFGSGMRSAQFRQLDAKVFNILARRICGVGMSARLPTLRVVAGAMTLGNLYIHHGAEPLNPATRAGGSSIQNRMCRWPCRAYMVTSWTPVMEKLDIPGYLRPQIGRLKYPDYDVGENWVPRVLLRTPALAEKLRAHSTYHCGAKEVRERPSLCALTYNYDEAHSWYEIGAQIAAAPGRRPDCPLGTEMDCARILPPHRRD